MTIEDSLYEVVRRAVANELQGYILAPKEIFATSLISPQPSDTGKLYLSAKEAADFIGIKLQTLYQNIERIPHTKKHGRLAFTRNGLIAYMEEK